MACTQRGADKLSDYELTLVGGLASAVVVAHDGNVASSFAVLLSTHVVGVQCSGDRTDVAALAPAVPPTEIVAVGGVDVHGQTRPPTVRP